MKIILIRHGSTVGNREKRYIGRTDEPLCKEGRGEIKSREYPSADTVICSPMKRCIETAEIIYPDKKPLVCGDLRECDFGDFEGKNYIELSGGADYEAWLESGGRMPFPNGESREAFSRRCSDAFLSIIRGLDCGSAAFVVHGGTIMSIMERFAHGDFYDYAVKNGGGFITEWDGVKIVTEGEIP